MPDILLAPVGNTRTDASRCPNKYLEITAGGAVGVYSNLPPYTNYITDRENGLLVGSEPDLWKEAIAFLLDDPASRVALLENAQNDVRTRFDTPVVLPRFLDFLMRASAAPAAKGAAAR